MNRTRRLVLAASAAPLLAFGSLAAAQPPAPPPLISSTSQFTPPPSPKGTLHRPLGTVVNENWNALIPVPAGTYTETDALTRIKCAEANGCTIIFRGWAQMSLISGLSRWLICPQIDDTFVAVACQPQDLIGQPEGNRNGSSFGSLAVAQGVHQVRTFAYFFDPGTLIAYHYEYELTTP